MAHAAHGASHESENDVPATHVTSFVFLYTQLELMMLYRKDDVVQSFHSPPSQPESYTAVQDELKEHASCAETKVAYDPVLLLQYVFNVFIGYVHPAAAPDTNARPMIAKRNQRRCDVCAMLATSADTPAPPDDTTARPTIADQHGQQDRRCDDARAPRRRNPPPWLQKSSLEEHWYDCDSVVE